MVESQRMPGVDLGSPSEPQVVRILLKNPWQKEEFLVHKEMLVRELKEHVGRHFSSSPDHIQLVYAGRILKDHRTLSQHGLHLDNDATVHVVLQSRQGSPSRQAPTVAAGATMDRKVVQENSAFARDRLRELTASLGLNTANFAQFQSQLMSKPEVMFQLLENPFIQSKLSSPDLLKELVTDNPQVRQVMERAPEISHFFSSPEGLRLVVALARNPAAVREIVRAPPQALGCPGSVPSGDNNGVPPDALTGLPGLIEKAIAKRADTPLGGNPTGHCPVPFDDCEEKPGRERLPLPKLCPPKLGVQKGVTGVTGHSKGESHGRAFQGEAGQLASTAVKNLLHQIIKHLVQNLAGSPSRTTSGLSPTLGTGAHVAQRKAAGSRHSRGGLPLPPAPVPVLLQQIQSMDLLLASWSPREIQGLLDIQHRLEILATDEPVAERRGRSERPARRAHSITSLCDLGLLSPGGESQDFSAQQAMQALIGSSIFARAKNPSRPRGSSAQPSAKQKRMYQL